MVVRRVLFEKGWGEGVELGGGRDVGRTVFQDPESPSRAVERK